VISTDAVVLATFTTTVLTAPPPVMVLSPPGAGVVSAKTTSSVGVPDAAAALGALTKLGTIRSSSEIRKLSDFLVTDF
jgi:hypothetical protein